jgi:hypothetical protein
MRFQERQTAVGAAILLLSATVQATHSHAHLEVLDKRHSHHHLHKKALTSPRAFPDVDTRVERRSGQCEFPTNAGLVAVTPGSQNAGWAMSPDQPCTPGSYCPYACPPGQLMAQWDPTATSYTYPKSMVCLITGLWLYMQANSYQNGGLYCDNSGQISKPFPSKPYCYDGTGSVSVKNQCGDIVAFCQTVLPGNEAMLIPTSVESSAELAIPGMSYWASTAAQ